MPIPEYSVPSAPWYSPYVVKQVMLLCETIFMYGILSEPELLEQSIVLIEFYKTGLKEEVLWMEHMMRERLSLEI
jgi:hypothetical protein